jgi:20S proteasome alpha/beta subunit
MLFFNRRTIQAIADFLKKSNNEITRFFCVHLEYNHEKIRTILREKYKKDLTISKGVKLGIEIFKEIKEKFDINKFELVYLTINGDGLKRIEGKGIELLK